MPDFIEAARLEELAAGSAIRILHRGGAVAIFAVGDRYRAIDDVCLRCSDSLASGKLRNSIVRCRLCNWEYDLETGDIIGVPGLRAEVFDTVVRGARVLLALPARSPDKAT